MAYQVGHSARWSGAPRDDDIAVVGIGCRFPGGIRTADGLWQALRDGTDVISEVPPDRWDDTFHAADDSRPGTIRTRLGGFLDDLDRFDAGFFGIAPGEAAEMDPQQRISLEVAFEAMQDAGRPMAEWSGTRTSVFMGMLGSDYLLLHTKAAGHRSINPYFASGKEFSFTAGRIAYTFGLQGPCMTVSTACSSSLTAVHLACQSLRDGTSDMALAGGVNALVTPELSIFMSKVQAMSPTGRCRPFDAAADGIVRGEGCAIVALKRYADAVRDHDQVYGLILGSAVNHDGRSAGLTVPNALAQQDLLRQALAAAGVAGIEPAYVEAHGTGTPLGDPLEVSALAEVMGRGRDRGRPLVIGSLKANFGHMDATAGVAGLIKTLLVLAHGIVPRQLHYRTPSPHIVWDGSGVTVAAEDTTLVTDDKPLTGGVSAFGLSGTNVHVVVGGPPPRPMAAHDGPRNPSAPLTLVLSATTAAGLRKLAGDYAGTLDPDGPAARVAAAAAVRRTHHTHRLAVVGGTTADLITGLRATAERRRHPAVHTGECASEVLPVIFAYSGHGAQWPGMALDLHHDEPVFRAAFDECDAALQAHSGWSVLDAVRQDDPSVLRSTEVGQPALFALQVALSRLWGSWGVVPDAVVGHSMGEVAAAHVAGALSLADAARIMVVRSRTLRQACGSGRMATVGLSVDEIRPRLTGHHQQITVAAVNGPGAVVLSGPGEPLGRLVSELQQEDIDAVELSVEYPSHGPLMEPYSRQLREILGDLTADRPRVPFLSTTRAGATDEAPDADYWAANLLHPVLFWPAVDRVLAEKDAAIVEIGAHPVLNRALRAAMAHRDRIGPVVASMVRGERADGVLAKARARLHVAGVPVDWSALWPSPVPAVPLPPERWATTTYWLAGIERGTQGPRAGEAVPERHVPVGTPPAAPVARPSGDRESLVRAVQNTLAGTLGRPAGDTIGIHRGFFELGLDSISAVEFAGRVTDAVRRRVDGTDVLRCGTIAELVGHIMAVPPLEAQPRAEQEAPAAHPDPDPVRSDGCEPIAVVGLACRVPGGADAEAFWQLLDRHVDPSGDVPAGRWDAGRLLADGVTSTARGSFLDAVDGFDHGFFRVSAREARSMDPQQRLFLEVAWESLEDAGLPAEELRDSETGVYVGLNTTDYQQLVLSSQTELDLYYGTGTCFSGAAGRLSYLLGLRGPSIAVDTACSSSLTAVHLACQALRAGECEVAVAGGANVMATPTVFRAMSAAGALSRDGRCKTFAENADGYGRGEGAGAVVLKPLSRALADGDRIHAVIRGSAVNQDGASGGLTVPSGTAQQAVITAALRRAGLSATELSYLEAHGTGTPLGDAVELRAIADLLRTDGPADQPLLVGSVKSNIGHLEAAAGVVGLIKVVLSLQHERIPAQLHLDMPTRKIDWRACHLTPVQRSTPWRRGRRRRIAGVSAFGFTGTNAHVIVEEPPHVASPTPAAAGPYLLTVSAVSRPALTDAMAQLAEQLPEVEDSDMYDLAWTSVARRTHHEHRAAVVAATPRALSRALRSPQHTATAPAGEPQPMVVAFGDEAPAWSGLLDATAALPGWERRAATALRDRITKLMAVLQPVLPSAGAGTAMVARAAAFVDQMITMTIWQTIGLQSQFVTGEGLGVYVAACVAGEIPPEEALRRLVDGSSLGDVTGEGPIPRIPMPSAPADETGLVLDLGRLTPVVRHAGTVVHRLAPKMATPVDILNTVAALHVRGARIRWTALVPDPGRVTSLPAYPWQRTHHWVTAAVDVAPPAVVPETPPVASPSDSSTGSAIAALPPGDREATLIGVLLPVVAEVLGDAGDIDPDRGFFDLGFDSVLSLKLKRRVEGVLNTTLPNTVLFECPTTTSLARFIAAEILPGGTESAGDEPPGEDPEGEDFADISDEGLTARLAAVLAAAGRTGGPHTGS